MQIFATLVDFLSVICQYSLLALILFFIYKTLYYIQKDVRPLVREVYNEVEGNHDEAAIIMFDASDTSKGTKRFVIGDELVIGRNNECNVQIQDNFVSQFHARISVLNNQYVLEDLNSANGTYVNDVLLENKIYLQNGDRISIGTIVFEFMR